MISNRITRWWHGFDLSSDDTNDIIVVFTIHVSCQNQSINASKILIMRVNMIRSWRYEIISFSALKRRTSNIFFKTVLQWSCRSSFYSLSVYFLMRESIWLRFIEKTFFYIFTLWFTHTNTTLVISLSNLRTDWDTCHHQISISKYFKVR